MKAEQQPGLGDLLREFRLRAGLTQEELAERSGVSGRSISDLERGLARTPWPQTLRHLSEALDLSGDERTLFEATARRARRVAGTGFQAREPGAAPEHPGQPHEIEWRSPRVRLPRIRMPTLSPQWGAVVLVALCGTAAVASLLALQPSRTANASIGSVVPGWGSAPFAVSRLERPAGIAVAGDGDVFVVDTGLDRVLRFSARGKLLASWGGRGRQPGRFREPSAIAIDPSGLVYVADAGNNRVQVFSSRGQFLRSWGSWGVGEGQLKGPDGIAVDGRGDVFVSDVGNGRVEEFTSSGKWIATVLDAATSLSGPIAPGQLTFGASGALYVADANGNVLILFQLGGPNGNQGLVSDVAPGGIAADSNRHLFVGDRSSGQIEEYLPANVVLRRWGPDGSRSTRFGRIGGLAQAPDGTIYVTDAGRSRIGVYSPTGRVLASWGPRVGPASLQAPRGVAVAPHGNILVADTGNNRIVELSPSGNLLATWGSLGAAPGQFDQPDGVATDRQGYIYVADRGNNRVQKLAPDGRALAVWGARPAGAGILPVTLNAPSAVAVAPDGRVLVATSYGTTLGFGGGIYVFTPTGRLTSIWPRQGTARNTGYLVPSALAVDHDGVVYVADEINPSVTVLTADGRIRHRWPLNGSGLARALAPRGLTVDASGTVVLADVNRDRIDKFSPDGKLLVSVGGTGSGPGRLEAPGGVAVDQKGDIFVADTGNDRVQKFAPGR